MTVLMTMHQKHVNFMLNSALTDSCKNLRKTSSKLESECRISEEQAYQECWRPRTIRYSELEKSLICVVDADPSLSTRCKAVRKRVSHMTVWRILHENLLYPYHYQCAQELNKGDFEPRRCLCHRMLQQYSVFINFLACILFTDQAAFTRDGIFNFHNTHN